MGPSIGFPLLHPSPIFMETDLSLSPLLPPPMATLWATASAMGMAMTTEMASAMGMEKELPSS